MSRINKDQTDHYVSGALLRCVEDEVLHAILSSSPMSIPVFAPQQQPRHSVARAEQEHERRRGGGGKRLTRGATRGAEHAPSIPTQPRTRIAATNGKKKKFGAADDELVEKTRKKAASGVAQRRTRNAKNNLLIVMCYVKREVRPLYRSGGRIGAIRKHSGVVRIL